ncbi:hypothetical protein V5O48_013732 [Marasmius crinis-equi]|uniref:Alpha-type protein kinase domain-containing protein n=1 Tax=Marasmius crinis-equi TaxID=585013 RepID=A0ABR3EZN7_9AGAR
MSSEPPPALFSSINQKVSRDMRCERAVRTQGAKCNNMIPEGSDAFEIIPATTTTTAPSKMLNRAKSMGGSFVEVASQSSQCREPSSQRGFDVQDIRARTNAAQKNSHELDDDARRMPPPSNPPFSRQMPRSSGSETTPPPIGYRSNVHTSTTYSTERARQTQIRYATDGARPGLSQPANFLRVIVKGIVEKDISEALGQSRKGKKDPYDVIPNIVYSSDRIDWRLNASQFANLAREKIFPIIANEYPNLPIDMLYKSDYKVVDIKDNMYVDMVASAIDAGTCPQPYFEKAYMKPRKSGKKKKDTVATSAPLVFTHPAAPFIIAISFKRRSWMYLMKWLVHHGHAVPQAEQGRLDDFEAEEGEITIVDNSLRASSPDDHSSGSSTATQLAPAFELNKSRVMQKESNVPALFSVGPSTSFQHDYQNSSESSVASSRVATPKRRQMPNASQSQSLADNDSGLTTGTKRTRVVNSTKTPPRPTKRVAEYRSPDKAKLSVALSQGSVRGGPAKALTSNQISVSLVAIPQLELHELMSQGGRVEVNNLDNQVPATLLFDPEPMGKGAFKLAFKGHITINASHANEKGHPVLRGEVVLKRPYFEIEEPVRSSAGATSAMRHVQKFCPLREETDRLVAEANVVVWADSLLSLAQAWIKKELAGRMAALPETLPIFDVRYVQAALVTAYGPFVGTTNRDLSNRTMTLIAEEVMHGTWKKYINNASATISPDADDLTKYLSFIQHIQWYKTNHAAYVSDFQGVGCLLSDPQILTARSVRESEEQYRSFGDGNVHDSFERFSSEHACNGYCKWFMLDKLASTTLSSEASIQSTRHA